MKYFEDFQLGEKIVTRGRTITEADFVLFAAISGDWHPIHIDIEFAKQTQFEERILHGMGVLALTSGLISPEHFMPMAFVAFYGMDKVRFTTPTKIGDTLHAELEVTNKQEKTEKFGVIEELITIKNQKGEEAASYLSKYMIARRQK